MNLAVRVRTWDQRSRQPTAPARKWLITLDAVPCCRRWLLAASMMTGELAREGPKQAAFMAYGWEGARCTVQVR